MIVDRLSVKLYHGSASPIDRFSLEHLGSNSGHDGAGLGVYLTSKPELASQYADMACRLGGGGQVVYPVWARLQNPYRYDTASAFYADAAERAGLEAEWREVLMKAGFDGIVVRSDYEEVVVFDPAMIDFDLTIDVREQTAMFKPASAEEFQSWFAGSAVVRPDGQPLMVHHGTTVVKVVPGETRPGDANATAELQALAAQHGIPEANDVPVILERWVAMGMAANRGVTPEDAVRSRALLAKSRPHVTRPSEVLGFDAFELPSGDKELGAHFGTRTHASGFGNVFDFYLRIGNPLRLPDLGTWHYQSVMREVRRQGVSLSEDEYTAVFNAQDNNAALRELLLSKGFDGVVYANKAEGSGDSFIVFQADQVVAAVDVDASWAQVPGDVAVTWAAERLLKQAGLEILSDTDIASYNAHRYDDMAMRPCVDLAQLQWTSYAGYLQKHFYVRDPEQVEAGLLRTAYYYPDGAEGDDGAPLLIIVDESDRELDSIRGDGPAGSRETVPQTAMLDSPSP